MALQTLLSARAALESTRGSATTPTRFVYFENGSHSQEVATIRPAEKRNSYAEAFRAYAGIERNRLEFSGALTFDQAVFWANLHVMALGTATGATVAKTWAFVPSLTSDTLKSASVQFGYADSIGATLPAWQVNGVLGDELTIDWAKDDVVRFSSSLIAAGSASQISAFTGSISDLVTVDALGINTTVTIDTTTIGSTADANVLDASWTLSSNFTYLDALNGTAVASSVLRPAPRTWSLAVTRYYANDTELDLYLTKTPRKVRIKTIGPALGTATYAIQLDCYGVWDTYEKTEADGLGVEKMTLRPIYDATAANDFLFTVVNADATTT